MDYTLITKLEDLIEDIPEDSIISRTIHRDESLKVILFGFAVDQQLSEHTAAKPAILHFLEGNAGLSLGADSFEVGPGAWVHMPAHTPHSVLAKTKVVMLLLLLQVGDL